MTHSDFTRSEGEPSQRAEPSVYLNNQQVEVNFRFGLLGFHSGFRSVAPHDSPVGLSLATGVWGLALIVLVLPASFVALIFFWIGYPQWVIAMAFVGILGLTGWLWFIKAPLKLAVIPSPDPVDRTP